MQTPNNILNPNANMPFVYNTNYVPNTTDRFWYYFDFLCYPVIGTPLRFIVMIYIIYRIMKYMITRIVRWLKKLSNNNDDNDNNISNKKRKKKY